MMRRFMEPVICFIIILAAFNYSTEVIIAGEQITVVDNYSIALDSNTNWGKLKLNMYLHSIDNDLEMTIYNPNNEIYIKETLLAGEPIDDVFYLNAEKGTWLVDLNTDKADLSYNIEFSELYMTGLKDKNIFLYLILLILSLIISIASTIGIKQFFRIKELKNMADIKRYEDINRDKCKTLKSSCFAKKIKSIYIMDIGIAHIRMGDYFKAKETLDTIPVNRKGEVIISRPWIKIFYLNYISVLLELNEVEKAENMFNAKKEILYVKTLNNDNCFFTEFIETVILFHKAEYKNSINRLLPMLSLIKKDEDVAEVNFLLSKSYYGLNNIQKTKEYLRKSKELASRKGLIIKIADFEDQVDNLGIAYEV